MLPLFDLLGMIYISSKLLMILTCQTLQTQQAPTGIAGVKPNLIFSQLTPSAPRVFASFLTENLFVKATGSITLHSKDPRISPVIQLDCVPMIYPMKELP